MTVVAAVLMVSKVSGKVRKVLAVLAAVIVFKVSGNFRGSRGVRHRYERVRSDNGKKTALYSCTSFVSPSISDNCSEDLVVCGGLSLTEALTLIKLGLQFRVESRKVRSIWGEDLG